MTRKSRGTTGTNELDAVLQFPSANVMAPIPVGAVADYLLLAAVRDQDIVLTLPFPDAGSPGDTIQLLVDGQPAGGEVAIGAYFPDKDIPIPLPATARVTEGLHALNYKLLYRSGAGNDYDLGPAGQQFIVDYTSPAGALPQAPAFAPDVVADGVTPERLTTDADGNEYLPGRVHSYFGQAAGDTLTGYIDSAVATLPIEVAVGGEGIDVQLRYTRAALDLATDGRHDFTYDIVDRAGNRSVRSVATPLLVRMHELIPDVLPPRVPAASDGLLNHADIHDSLGAVVEIPPNALVLPGDVVIVTWGAYEAAPRTVAAGDIGNDPLVTIVVPYADVYATWFAASAGADMRVLTNVSYRIMRGGVLAGEPKAPTAVVVNLSSAGGVDPDPETPENEALYPPTIYSSSGNANFIPIADQQVDGFVEIAWTRVVDGEKVFAIGDIVTVLYGTTTLASYTVTAADMTAAKPLRLILPVAAIAAEGVGVIKTSYTIERRLAAGGANIAISPPQSVTVEDEADLPGNGELAEGFFPEMNVHLTLGPAEISNGTAFVGDYTGRRAGDTIRFEFRFVEGNFHSPAETPIDARYHSGILTLAADDDPVEYLIAEEFLNYREQPPEQMHIHGTYHVRRGMGSEVHSPDSRVLLDCRGAAPPFSIDRTPVEIIGTAAFTREAVNGTPPYTYVSSDPAIVAVPDEHAGLIKGVADGSATIMASDTAAGGDAYHVIVVGNLPFTIDGAPVTVTGIDTFTREAKGGVPPYTYVSNASDVVAVPDRFLGIIQGVADGSATITAHDRRAESGTYDVTVVGNTPFSFDNSSVQIIRTATFTRHATGGTPPYTYASSTPDVVRVPDPGQGLIQGVTDGLAVITARDSAHGFGTYTATVVGNTPFSVDTSPVQIIGTNTFTRRAFGGIPPYIYSSDTPSVVKVPDPDQPIVQGVSDGNAFISVRDQDQGSGFYHVTVIGNTPFAIDPRTVTIVGTGTATRSASGGVPPYTYVSSAPGVAMVPNTGQGIVRGVSDGEAIITARDTRDGEGSYQVTVVGNTPFTIDTTPATLIGTGSLTRDASGGVPPYTYVSSAPGVAMVPNAGQGVVRGASDGEAIITARDTRDGEGSYQVTVVGNTPFAIDTTPATLIGTGSLTRDASGGVPPYTYVSSAPGVAMVPNAGQGVVRGASDGEAIITARDTRDGEGSYQVTVVGNTPFAIDTTPATLIGSGSLTRDASGGVPPYTYVSSAPGVATVPNAGQGVVRGASDGEAIITARDTRDGEGSYQVTVVGNTPFTIDTTPVTLIGTGSLTRNASGGVPPYSYVSNAPGVVKVPDVNQGLIQGVTDGKAFITASDTDGGVKSYEVTVTDDTPPFTIDTTPVTLTGTGSLTRNASGGVPPYSYVSNAPGVVKVPNVNQGLIQGVTDGKAFITASDTDGGVKSYEVTVTGNTPPFTIDTTPVTLTGTGSLTRNASGGVPPYSYVSNAPRVVKVPNVNQGLIQGVTDGSARITASDTAGGMKSYEVTVTGNMPPFTIDTTPVTLTGTGSLTRNASGGVPPYSYVSNAPGVVKVPNINQGLIRGVTDGSARITASDTAGGIKSYDVTVTGNTPPFTIDTTPVTLDVGETQRRQASGGTPPYSYTSNKPTVATVNASTGLVTARTAGAADITASDGNDSGSYRVTVKAVAPPLYIDPSMMRLEVGERDKRQATGGRPPYTYSSNDLNIVAVGTDGGTLGLGAGSAKITVRDTSNTPGGSKSYDVTVTAKTPFTIDTTPVTLSGTASFTRNASGGVLPYRYVSNAPNVVKVPDAGKGQIQAASDGVATITASDSATGNKSYNVTVSGNTPPLTIDTTPVNLPGPIYRGPALVLNPPPGAFVVRQASGGRPPYRYSADNKNIVDVDATTGRVIARGKGTTWVRVTDNSSQQRAYQVTVDKVAMFFGTGVFSTYTQCRKAAEAQGGRLPNLSEWAALRACYNGVPGFGNRVAWATDSAGIGKRWGIQPDSGTTVVLIDFGIGGSTADGFAWK